LIPLVIFFGDLPANAAERARVVTVDQPVGDISCIINQPRENIPVADGKVRTGARLHGFFAQTQHDAVVHVIRGNTSPSGSRYSNYHSISATPLSCLFSRYPYRDEQSIWPRVAITILSMPTDGDAPFTGLGVHTAGCWEMRATIWYSTTQSVDVSPFQWCGSEVAYNLATVNYDRWVADSAGYMENGGGRDPGNRSEGPSYPGSVIPIGSNDPSFSTPNNGNGQMAANIVYRMGLNWNHPDGRVWFSLAK
jgi:hypothetical protein